MKCFVIFSSSDIFIIHVEVISLFMRSYFAHYDLEELEQFPIGFISGPDNQSDPIRSF